METDSLTRSNTAASGNARWLAAGPPNPMSNRLLSTSVLAILVAVAPMSADAQMSLRRVASGLEAPVAFVQVPSDSTAQVILEHSGRIRLLKDGTLQDDFLDLRTVVKTGNEWGLVGLAFASDYASSGRLFVTFTEASGHTVVARFTATSDLLHPDPATRFDLVWPGGTPYIPQPDSPMHKGGNMAFGPDGYLYIGLGDGGSGDDPDHRAQDPLSLLGKMLRIDVAVGDDDPEGYDVPPSNPFVGRQGVLPEIWAFGLRNPWRWSFDDVARGGTGALIITDVGQDSWEEVDYEPAGAGGRNYGWRNREGSFDHVTTLPTFSAVTDPTFQYSHEMGRSIIGGFVYRGNALGPQNRGRYFFADFMSGGVWALDLSVDPQSGEGSAVGLTEFSGLGYGAVRPSSFGVDADGELYLVSYAYGTVYRFEIGAPIEVPLSACVPPDPFAAMGGGTCVNQGWMPPGFTPVPHESSTPPAPSGGPPESVPSGQGSPGTAGCEGPDPFTAMGGGFCANGGWTPAGSAPPAPQPPAPQPPPSPGLPAPNPASPPQPTTDDSCQTPDPFASMGGGRCVNGGWSMSSSPPASPPPASPPPASPPEAPPGPASPPSTPSPSPCATTDPFVALGGGVCVNGGWLPPGSAAAPSQGTAPEGSAPAEPPPANPLPSGSGGCSGPDPFAGMETIKGICVNGGWVPVPR